MMKAIALALLCTAVLAAPRWYQLEGYSFDQYIRDFSKPYVVGTEEYTRRQQLFEANLQSVQQFNSEQHSWKKGVNHMTDWNFAELMALNGRVPDAHVTQPAPERIFTPTGGIVQESVDYRQFWTPVLTAIKDQGQCGSCWAHAATESVETAYALATGELYVLSQQQITSCTNNSQHCGGTGGCAGATAQLGWDYVVQAGGQVQEWVYGYTSYWGDSGVCDLNVNMTQIVELTGYTQVESNNAGAVVEALNTFGPLAVSVDASAWGPYETGIFDGCDYAKNISMDHAVQLIGYGVDQGQEYWLIRNSWSASWGENGTIRLVRNQTEQCGWNNDWNTNGGGCPGGANTVWACGQCGILFDTAFPNVKSGSGQSSTSKAWIAGAVIGGVVVVAVIVAVFFKVSASGSNPEQDQLLDRQ